MLVVSSLTVCDVVNSVILRPKAEESLANARNVRVSETVSERVSGTSPEILRFAQDDIIHQRSFVANAPQDDNNLSIFNQLNLK